MKTMSAKERSIVPAKNLPQKEKIHFVDLWQLIYLEIKSSKPYIIIARQTGFLDNKKKENTYCLSQTRTYNFLCLLNYSFQLYLYSSYSTNCKSRNFLDDWTFKFDESRNQIYYEENDFFIWLTFYDILIMAVSVFKNKKWWNMRERYMTERGSPCLLEHVRHPTEWRFQSCQFLFGNMVEQVLANRILKN